MSSVEVLSRSELERRRKALLARVRIGEDELRRRADDYQTTSSELEAIHELAELDFLLGK